jgi:hypothetical protein
MIGAESACEPEDEAERALDLYLENPHHPLPIRLKASVFALIAQRSAAATSAKDFRTVARLSQVEQSLRLYFHRYLEREPELCTPSPAFCVITARLTAVNTKADSQRSDFLKARAQSLSDLQHKHEEELAQFQREWSQGHSYIGFSKASPFLLQLRDVERRRLLLCDVRGAERTRQHADDIQAVETVVARERAGRQWQIDSEKLRQKHAAELDAAEAFTQQGLLRLRKKREAKTLPLESALKKVEQNDAKPEQPRERSPGGEEKQATEGLANSVGVPKLDFDGFDARSYVNQKRAATQLARSRLAEWERKREVPGWKRRVRSRSVQASTM